MTQPTPRSASDPARVVATLDEPLHEGASTIWCASLAAAWQALGREVAGEPAVVADDDGLSRALNGAQDVGEVVPDGGLYAAAGLASDGIAERIAREMAERFPGREVSGLDGDVVAYAYLDASLAFAIPYPVARTPLSFRQSDGAEVPVQAFGLREADVNQCLDLRRQAQLLFHRSEGHDTFFAVDLDGGSAESQLIVARVPRPHSLGDALRYLEGAGEAPRSLGPRDLLLVPKLSMSVSHREGRLEGRSFEAGALRGITVVRVQQDVRFALDEAGAQLSAWTEIGGVLSDRRELVVSSAFLVVMRRRGAVEPFFVAWVDDAAMMLPWDEASLPDEPPPPPEVRATMVQVEGTCSRLPLELSRSKVGYEYAVISFQEDHGATWRRHLSIEELNSSDLYLELAHPDRDALPRPLTNCVRIEHHAGGAPRWRPLEGEPTGVSPRAGAVLLAVDTSGPAWEEVLRSTSCTLQLDPELHGATVSLVAVRNPERHRAWKHSLTVPRFKAVAAERRDDGVYLLRFDQALCSPAKRREELQRDGLWVEIEGGAEDEVRDKLPSHLLMAGWAELGAVIQGTTRGLRFTLHDQAPAGLEGRDSCVYAELIKDGPLWDAIVGSSTFAMYLSVFHARTKLTLYRARPPAQQAQR